MYYLTVDLNGIYKLFRDKPERSNLGFWYSESDYGFTISKGMLRDRYLGLTWKNDPLKFY